ncbi:hypothetical protein CAPTEDRAFT_200350 [Capitella teleta]|uniref:EF-hand domain-containing protein n=1 Tax=Capitella teleta TaxID=283909 RepID=R7UTG7_CAPTE|nr:hypothetical protein CAPTEDRAFT_200350 [Capitella teleta]|eukprot:ELU09480.1 hypothetical protein CAPTEDRAFT_200350 [Capitella teleta]
MASSFAKISESIAKNAFTEIPLEESEDEEEKEEKEDEEVKEEEKGSSDFYDTDLDGEDRATTPYDAYGLRTYMRACRKMKINPVGAVRKGLSKKEIRVKGRGMDKRDALAICSALQGNIEVVSLIVDDNNLGWIGVGYVALMMCENEVIRTLGLAKNQIGKRGCRVVMEMLLENHVLSSLDISGNQIDDNDMEFIAKIIKDNRNLTYLNLSHNNISDKGAKFLQPAIADNETLRSLDLSWNKIRPRGGVAISEGLAENVVMSSISLAYNGLCITGARAMGECLQINEILTDLDLTCNRMFDEGVAFIAKALSTNENLQKLRISNNAMTTASVITVLTTIQENPESAIVLLDMSNMHIYKEALGLANEIVFSNPKFKFLYGGVVNSDHTNSGAQNFINQKQPMKILQEFMSENNLRISDLFKQLDRDGSGTISRNELCFGLQSMELIMTNAQIDKLIEQLDSDADGEISITEFLVGDREYKRKQLLKKQADISRLRQERQARRLARLQEQASQEEKSGREDIPREMLHAISKMLIDGHKK